MSQSNPVIVWFRQDFRLADHAALWHACQEKAPVMPVYVWDESAEGEWPLGAASKVWLRQSLGILDARLRQKGSRLLLLSGKTESVLRQFILETNARAVFCHRRYEPAAIRLEQLLDKTLPVRLACFDGALLHRPECLMNKQGKPYQVYTPFWKALYAGMPEVTPLPEPKSIPAPEQWPGSLSIDDLPLVPPTSGPRWDGALMKHWQVGEKSAKRELAAFLQKTIGSYGELRDRPGEAGTSRLSPHLHFGEVSPRQIWIAVHEILESSSKLQGQSASVFLKELVWREFSHHLLFHCPNTPGQALRPEFRNFPWQPDAGMLERWEQGKTGYPIVDAGMRELWATGWMHNRVRMIVGSFLVKNLLHPWQGGARWFWDTLVDADLAQNTMNWQWVAGCGADASPYFRIFNPILQGDKFDPEGHYVKRWIPELAPVETKWIHQPWKSGKRVKYPTPVVDHNQTRNRALAAYKSMRQAN